MGLSSLQRLGCSCGSFRDCNVMLFGLMVLATVPGRATGDVIWPVKTDNNHQMLNGFGDGTPNNIYKFHEGIDILASGKGGEDIVAARGGKVLWNNPNYVGGMVTIEVDVGGGSKQYDRYLHVSNIAAPAETMDIAAGAAIGKISATQYEEGRRHLHLSVLNAAPPRASAPAENTHLNPFLRFTSNADRDPLSKIPRLEDTNSDKKLLLVTRSGTANAIAKQTIDGDVDLIADARDPMHDSLLRSVNPHRAGYYVKPLFDKGVVAHGVKTADAPYILAQFDDNWFAGTPFTNGKFPLVYDESRPVDPNPVPNSTSLKHMIVTNTKGTDGRPANVVDEYWNTNAKDDGSADTVAHANFAGKDDTGLNAMARFKDGEYEMHTILGDVVNTTVDVTAGKVRLDNFKQSAGPGRGGRVPVVPVDIPLYGPNSTPYVPDFLPEPSVASLDAIFHLFDPIGITGAQYYPDLIMPAFIFPHHSAWLEDDPFVDFIVKIGVLSDSTGFVPLTFAWIADRLGDFDVIIDYDRDGLFTWTMDGLGGFGVVGAQVVPEPATLSLSAIAGAIGTASWLRGRQRRRRRARAAAQPSRIFDRVLAEFARIPKTGVVPKIYLN